MNRNSNAGWDDTHPANRMRFAHDLFAHVLQSVSVPRRMEECFRLEGELLVVGEQALDLSATHRVLLAAIGKAAVPMAEHALAVLRSRFAVQGAVDGVGVWTPPQGVAYFEGGHPLPNEHSFAAAHALMQLVQTADEGTLVVFLISGGASAMAEAPLNPAIRQDEVIAFYKRLLHSGLPIAETNTVRKHLSLIKGGRLALACGAALRCTVLISDVPPNRLDVVGSGPSLADASTVAECRRLLVETPSLCDQMTSSIAAFFEAMPETPKVLPEPVQPAIVFPMLSSESLLQSAKRFAEAAGYRVVIDNACDDWDYRDAASYLLERGRAEAQLGDRVCVLSAGEVTVTIAGQPGLGGRNQQWALEVARLIAGDDRSVAMSAGSDGIDGNSPGAGAVVDGSTWERAVAGGLDPQRALDAFDAYPLFELLGDVVMPGPTGNNLRDLRMMLVDGAQVLAPQASAQP